MESHGSEDPSRRTSWISSRPSSQVPTPDLIVVKNCKTRYGQVLTTGQALIYESAEAMKVEPGYIHERHKGFRSGNATEEVAEEAAEETEDGGE